MKGRSRTNAADNMNHSALCRGKSSGRPKKRTKFDNGWFVGLQVGDLKPLCKASKMIVGGRKAELCSRLRADDFVAGLEGKRASELTELCRSNALPETGAKIVLVKRLLNHHYFGTAPDTSENATVPPVAAAATGIVGSQLGNPLGFSAEQIAYLQQLMNGTQQQGGGL